MTLDIYCQQNPKLLMNVFCLAILMTALFCVMLKNSTAQNTELHDISKVPSKYFEKISSKSNSISEKLDAKTDDALIHLQRQEAKIKLKFCKIDSLAPNNIFTTTEQRYKKLKKKLNSTPAFNQYIPFPDTLKTSLKFLNRNKELLAKKGNIQQQPDGAMNKINDLEPRIQKAEEVKKFPSTPNSSRKLKFCLYGIFSLFHKLPERMQ